MSPGRRQNPFGQGHHRTGASWGYAVSPSGALVIRNWYLLVTWIVLALIGLIIAGAFISQVDGSPIAAVSFVASAYAWWGFHLEWAGVRIGNGSLSYPVRLGFDVGIAPLFRKAVPMSDVLEASSLTLKNGARAVYLSGEFGQAKLLFDTKGGRDRLLALLKARFPEIKIYRWA